jgi:hypothetical protein
MVCEPKDLPCSETSFSQEAYINPVFAEEVIQFRLSAANAIRVPAGHT